MFSHIVVGANDIPAAKRFYDAVLGALGHSAGMEMGERVFYRSDTASLLVTKPIDGNAACLGNGMTIGLVAADREAVDAFHAAGLAAGGSDAGAPGPRPAMPGSYAAYVRDPTGNKLVAWCAKAG
ncbi:MAG: VOC family protein [Novosphingobium sp.]